MNKTWKQIWNSSNDQSFDHKNIYYSLIGLNRWEGWNHINNNNINYVDHERFESVIEFLDTQCKVNQYDSLFEVGCGCGASLFPFFSKGNKVGGIDYSEILIKYAQEILTPNYDFTVGEADSISDEKYDIVFSNGVFLYFPNIEYSENVLTKMIKKSNKYVAILEIPDLTKREGAEIKRKNTIQDYEVKYKDLHHLYFDKKWFIDMGEKFHATVEIFDNTDICGSNSNLSDAYRFGCVYTV